MTSSLAAIRVKSAHLIKSCLKTRKGRNMEIKESLHKFPWFRNGIHSLLSRADAGGSADIIYRM